MKKVSFALPKNFNNGAKIPIAQINKIESEVIGIAGGLTKYNALGF